MFSQIKKITKMAKKEVINKVITSLFIQSLLSISVIISCFLQFFPCWTCCDTDISMYICMM